MTIELTRSRRVGEVTPRRPKGLDTLLANRPDARNWRKICDLATRSTPAEIRAMHMALAHWPATLRTMPDPWWAEWTAGVRQPRHGLAGSRVLGPALDNAPVAVACSDNYDLVLVAGAGGTPGGLGLWDVPARRWRATSLGEIAIPGEAAPVDGARALFTPGGSLLAVLTEDEPAVLRVWDTASGTPLWSAPLTGGTGGMFRPGLGTDALGAHLVATAGPDGPVAVFVAATGERIFADPDGVCAAALNDEGDHLALGLTGGHVVVRELSTGATVAQVPSGLRRIDSVSFASDTGTVLAAGLGTGQPGTPRPALSWVDMHTGSARIINLAATLPVTASTVDAQCPEIVWSSHGARVLVRCSRYHMFVVDGGGLPLFDLSKRLPQQGSAIRLTEDGRAVLVAGQDIRVWPLDSLTVSAVARH
jgi:hypothetical protein